MIICIIFASLYNRILRYTSRNIS